MARYEAGETLASIARTYDCSAPAISYIVSRSRTRGVAPSVVGARRLPWAEPAPIESHGTEMPVHEPLQEKSDVVDEPKNVDVAGASASNDGPSREDHRSLQTLHLSQPHRHDEPVADELMTSHVAAGHKDPARSGNGVDGRSVPDERNSKEGGTFIDLALRHRVQSDIATFLAAFDAALSRDTSETRAGLREATDRLLRAGARTRIELERLEARAPLPTRDGSRPPESPWRQR
jgi:hypothetical protein